MFYNKLQEREQKAFRIHLIFSILEGIVVGVTMMNEFVFLRSLEGTEFLTGVLFFATMGVFMSLILLNELIRRSQNKKKLIRKIALISRLPLLLFFFFPSQITQSNDSYLHFAFIGIFFIYFLGTTMTLPTINLLLRDNYQKNNFGKLYGYSATAQKVMVLIATFVFGQMLYQNYFVFRFVYPSIGLLSVIALFSLSAIPYTKQDPIPKTKISTSLKNSIKRMYNILKNDKPFLHFEMAFFAYGIAFMITSTVITFFLESFLGLSYASISTYKSGAGIVTVLALPLLGILSDKIDPRKFGIIMFGAMLLYVTFIMLTEYIDFNTSFGNIEIYYTLIIAFISFGIFTAAGTLSWNIGSSFFSKNPNDSADYQSVHISLTGIRALIAPIGVIIYKLMGYKYTFAISILFVILAIIILKYSISKSKK
jgi:predicted MFS family arabinose efflux permease